MYLSAVFAIYSSVEKLLQTTSVTGILVRNQNLSLTKKPI